MVAEPKLLPFRIEARPEPRQERLLRRQPCQIATRTERILAPEARKANDPGVRIERVRQREEVGAHLRYGNRPERQTRSARPIIALTRATEQRCQRMARLRGR